jgi:hypothetical protein
MTAQFVETGSTNRIGLGFGVFFIFAYVCFYSSCLDATMYLVPSEMWVSSEIECSWSADIDSAFPWLLEASA